MHCYPIEPRYRAPSSQGWLRAFLVTFKLFIFGEGIPKTQKSSAFNKQAVFAPVNVSIVTLLILVKAILRVFIVTTNYTKYLWITFILHHTML